MAHLPATHPARRRAHRTAHRPRRSTRHPARAALHAARRDQHDPPRAPDRRARALGLRRPLRSLGDQPVHRRPARRADPHRARPLPRRAHPHPDPRPLPTQPPRRTRRASPQHARRRRPRPAATDPHRRPPRRALDRRPSAPRLNPPQPRASGSHRSPRRPPPTGTPREHQATTAASDQQRERSGLNARRRTTPLDPAPFIASRSRRHTTPSVVRSLPATSSPSRGRRHHHPSVRQQVRPR